MFMSEKTCRLCMSTDAVTNLFIIDGDTTIDKKISVCTDLQISIGDGLPDVICKMCEMNIKNFYDFKQKCLFIDSKLRTNKLAKHCSYSPKKEAFDDTDLLTDSIKMDIKLECDNIFDKMDFKKAFDTWLSDDSDDRDSECHIEHCSNEVPIKFEEKSQRRQIHKPAPSNDEKIKVKKHCKNLRKSKITGQELYQCEICGRILKNKSVLVKHVATHSGIKEFSCKICSKTFTRVDHKVTHMRIHLGIKPYICEKCGKSFRKRQDLIRHMRIHSDVKNYACPRCDRRFKRLGDVHSHMRTHTGAKPYHCPLCDKSYSSHSGLRKHNKVHFKKETCQMKQDQRS